MKILKIGKIIENFPYFKLTNNILNIAIVLILTFKQLNIFIHESERERSVRVTAVYVMEIVRAA